MKSIIDNSNSCFLCGTNYNLHVHHCVFGTANRKLADQDGLWVKLCYKCHHGVHTFDVEDKERLQKLAQYMWEKKYGTREQFIERYGKSYL